MLIRNIWGLAKNYRDHASEMKSEVPTEPLIFLKAGSCASVNSNEVILPYWVKEVHHEVELALKLSQNLTVIEGAVALDLTERHYQSLAKSRGEPWTLSKSFDGSCPISASFQIRKWEDIADLRLRLWVNDQLRQDGRTSSLVFNGPQILDYLRVHFPICPGDFILTGTPAGVGPLQNGDVLRAEIEGQITQVWKVRQESPPSPSN